MIEIRAGGLDDPRVVALLVHHLETARAHTAAGSAHALDLSGLKTPDIHFFSAWDGTTLLGTGALKRLSTEHGDALGEVKSMHTAEAARRRGIGSKLLEHIMAVARAEGLTRLSLETGSWDYFAPARDLYARHGFEVCAPFGDYVPDRNSVFMTRVLRD